MCKNQTNVQVAGGLWFKIGIQYSPNQKWKMLKGLIKSFQAKAIIGRVHDLVL